MKYSFKLTNPTADDAFFIAHMIRFDGVSKEIVGTYIKDHIDVTIEFNEELTSTELETLKNYIDSYSDFDQTTVDNTILDQCRFHGEKLMREFELKNMDRKRNGQYTTIDIMRVMEEIHDAFIFMSILRGSYFALLSFIDKLSIGNGFKYPLNSEYHYIGPNEETGEMEDKVMIVTQEKIDMLNEDIQWAKNEVLEFMSSL